MTEEILKEIRSALLDRRSALWGEIKRASEISETLAKVKADTQCIDLFGRQIEEGKKRMESVRLALEWAYSRQ